MKCQTNIGLFSVVLPVTNALAIVAKEVVVHIAGQP